MSLYEDLGIAPDATPAEIKAAHRKLAMENHPDRGGDKEKFQQIQRAYDTLSDPDAREHYDRTGSLPDEDPSIRDQALHNIKCSFAKHLDEADEAKDLAHLDLIQMMQDEFAGVMANAKQAVEMLEKSIAKVEAFAAAIRPRLRGKTDKADTSFFYDVFDTRIAELRHQLLPHHRAIEVLAEASKILEDYGYDWEQAAPRAAAWPADYNALGMGIPWHRTTSNFGGF